MRATIAELQRSDLDGVGDTVIGIRSIKYGKYGKFHIPKIFPYFIAADFVDLLTAVSFSD
jgi:hypothetical protein